MKLLLLSLMVFSFGANANQVSTQDASTALDQLGSSNWGDAFNGSTDPAPSETNPGSTDVTINESEGFDKACPATEQSSIPYKFFLNLLANKELKIEDMPSANSMKVSTGMMIGNCNDMLDFNFAQPQNGRPYLLQVEIKRPPGCTGDVCEYDVQLADGGIATGEDATVSVAPNYYGFIQCLKDSGALNDDLSVNGGKVAAVEMTRTFPGMTDTNQVWFYSHGPEAAKMGGVHSGNKKRENACRFYEDVSAGGYTYFSAQDVEENRLIALKDEICMSGDYKLIERHLPDFGKFAWLKNIMEQVRDEYLKEEVKRIATELESNKKDLSKISSDRIAEYQDTLRDFYDKIVVPLRRDIELKIIERDAAPKGRQRKALNDELKAMIKELREYAQGDYPKAKHYEYMKDFLRKAPLDDEAWREAALSVYRVSNTAYHFSRYHASYQGDLDDEISTSAANKLITADISVEKEVLDKLGRLAEDTDSSIAREYRDRAEDITDARDDYQRSVAEFEQEEIDYLYNHCYNPAKYWVNRQRCAAEVMENIRYGREEDQYVYDAMREEYDEYNSEASRWDEIERARDRAYGVNRERGGNTSGRTARNGGTLNRRSLDPRTGYVDPRAFRAPDLANNYQDFYNRMMGQNSGVPQRGFTPEGYQYTNGSQFAFNPALTGRGPATSGYWPRPTAGNYATQGVWGRPNVPVAPGWQQYHLNSTTGYGPLQFRQSF